MKMSPTFLRQNTKKQGIDPTGLCDPWSDSLIKKYFLYQNVDNNKNMTKKTFRSLTN